jgi:hypothetical protein
MLASDPLTLFVPWDVQARRLLSRGEIPWNNEFAGRGAALFANPQTALLSPFTWPRLAQGERGWALSILARLVVGGLGASLFARELGAGPGPARLSGLVFLASGYSITYGMHHIANVFALLPWFAMACLRLLKLVTARNVVAVWITALLATVGGHPETLAFGVLGAFALVLLELRARRLALGRSYWIAGAAAVGLGTAAVQLGPFFTVLSEAESWHIRASAPMRGFQAAGPAALLVPGLFGSPLGSEVNLTSLAASLTGGDSYSLSATAFVGAVGLLALGLAFTTLAAPMRRGLIVALGALLLFWRVPPLEALHRAVPGLAVMGSGYAVAAFVLFAAPAVGQALWNLSDMPPRPRAGTAVVVLGVLLAAAGLAPSLAATREVAQARAKGVVERLASRDVLVRGGPEGYLARFDSYYERFAWTVFRRASVPGAFWVLAGCSLLVSRRRRELLVTAAVGELLAHSLGWFPAVRETEIPGEPPAIRDVKALDPERRWLILAADNVYPPLLSTLHEVRDVRQYDQLADRDWTARLMAAGVDDYRASYGKTLSPSQASQLAGLGVRYYLASLEPPCCARVGGAPPPGVGVYEIPDAVPQRRPANEPPRGLVAGAFVSLISLLALSSLVMRARAAGA